MAEQETFNFEEENKQHEEGTRDGEETMAFKVPEVSEAAWRELFATSEAVKKAAPWKKLYDGDWFGLKDPDSGQTAIGSVVGNARQVLGVHLYLQPEGVAFWNETVASEEPDMWTLQFRNRMLEIQFVNKGALQPEDWAVREQLGLPKPPNKGRPYVCFRSVRPYCLPWYLEEAEARLLALAGHAAIAHYRTFRFEEFEGHLDMGENNLPVIPTFALEEGGDPASEESWKRTDEEMPLAEPVDLGEADEGTLGRLREMTVDDAAVWQVGAVDFSEPTGGWERPFFARTTLAVDREKGSMLGYGFHNPVEPVASQFASLMASAGEKATFLPGVVECDAPETLTVLRPLADACGFTLKRRLRLDTLTSVAESLLRPQ